ncbi:DUF4491 family protein [Clostridium sp. NSJ-145]|uniref:DUF4491 family protein n=1 Tax=Clostridium sp. NSJ-145 TaxID=2897777 RepID=UPI001E437CE0|nr:DUF4491 family protein [Clostridium sp. NSJ-145]MCD2502291.1 DUF4491 family protein [Clostridium sp. NSJ-145]
MNFDGIIIGLVSFLIIGLFHPIVIKGEYHFSKNIWPIFLVVGIVFLAISLYIDNSILTASLGVTGFSCLWSIKELFEQEERVKKGWYPKKHK